MYRHDTILLASGSADHRQVIRAALGENYNLLEAGSPSQTLLLMKENRSCIAAILLDITQTGALDTEIMAMEDTRNVLNLVPVIILTDSDHPEVLDRGFSLGAADVIPLDYDAYAMLHRIENIVELHLHKANLEEMVAEQAEALRHHNEIMVDALSSIIEYRSVESGQHILRIRHFTQILLKELACSCPEYDLTEDRIRIISSAAALHDVGKIGIPDSILMKPGKLTPEEMEIMRSHTVIGCSILESLTEMGNAEYLRYAHNIAHYHHERWDGGGYPEGLAEENIPICAQVVGLADVYDALTSKRVYKDAYSCQTAVNMILNGECGEFSPKLLECFKRVLEPFEKLSREYADGLSPKTEKFDLSLPGPSQQEVPDSLNIINGKYLALLHYLNAFVLELSVDTGYFHLRYNPYPELSHIGQAESFAELERIVLDNVVVPEDRQRMEALIRTGIEEYLQAGMRRQSFRFTFRDPAGQPQPYDVTLLRANVNQKGNRSLAVLCRKLEAGTQSLPLGQYDPLSTEMVGATFSCRNDRDLTLIRLASGVESIAGYSREAIRQELGNRFLELVEPESRQVLRRSIQEQLARGSHILAEFRVRRRSGAPAWVMLEARQAVEADGQECLHCYMTDVSETRLAYESLREKINRYEIVLAQTENALFDWDLKTDRIDFSDTWQKIFGFAPVSRNVRQTLANGSYFHPDDLPLLMDRIRALENGSSYELQEVRIATAKGRYLWCRFRASALRDEAGNLERIVGLIINIDSEKQAERALQDRADRDALTKLLNKDAGRKQAEEYLAQFPQGVSCALLIIDLDNFKQVNDRYGHLFGDSVLTRAAKEIRKMFRSQDIVARIGGDEFMVLIRGSSDRGLVESRCSRLLATFRNVFRSGQQKLPISCSIGIALSPQHGMNYLELFRHADQALYQAKDKGKNSFVFYDSQDTSFHSWKKNITAVNNRIDSDEQPGMADGSIVQYAFQRLYSAKDVDTAVQDILRLIGEQMNVSRVYVFENSPDDRFCSNTYEWCNVGIRPEMENLQNVSYETDIPGYEAYFDENGIFYCPDVSLLPGKEREILEEQGIKSVLQCAIRDKGRFRGYIGFDECVDTRMWTREQIQILIYFSEMLSVFLLKKQSQEQTSRHADDLHTILDNQNAWIYIVDPETWQLKYLNAKLAKDIGTNAIGTVCHQALKGRSQPCPGCPLLAMAGKDSASALLCSDTAGKKVLAEAARIHWNGQDSCLMTCRHIPAVE